MNLSSIIISDDPQGLRKQAAATHDNFGVETSFEHFAVKSQENRRMSISAEVDSRTLFEHYLKAFEIAVTESKTLDSDVFLQQDKRHLRQ